MKVKLVKRYWCDFCNKGGLSAGHMRRHEKHCTLNPNRECRVCQYMKDERPRNFVPSPLSAMLAVLPDPAQFKKCYEKCYEGTQIEYFGEELFDAVDLVLPKLRELAGDCPACIMAALRQRGIPVSEVKNFHYADEMKEIWNAVNERHYEPY